MKREEIILYLINNFSNELSPKFKSMENIDGNLVFDLFGDMVVIKVPFNEEEDLYKVTITDGFYKTPGKTLYFDSNYQCEIDELDDLMLDYYFDTNLLPNKCRVYQN